MNIYLKNGSVYIDGKFRRINITVKGGKIIALGEENTDDFKEIDCAGKYVCAGFIDIHSHGANGVDVNSAKCEDFSKIACFFASKGTTSFLASVLTDSEDNTEKILGNIKAYQSAEHDGAELLGAHLEGPFLSAEKKGAMPEKLLRTADSSLLEKYLETDCVKYITVAPEVVGNLELIKNFSHRLRFAIGHSAADYDTALKAVENGAVSSTHTFNGMLGIDRLQPNILGAAMDSDIFNEIISDGVHVHPANIRMLYKLKGNRRVIAITDSIMATGLKDGAYSLGCRSVTVRGADAMITGTDTRAGSVLTMNVAFKNLMNFLGESAENVLPMLSENPADLLGITKGYIKVGYDADFTILNPYFDVVSTIVGGKVQKG